MTTLRGRTTAGSDGCRALLAVAAAEVPVPGHSEPLDAVAHWSDEQLSGGYPEWVYPSSATTAGALGGVCWILRITDK